MDYNIDIFSNYNGGDIMAIWKCANCGAIREGRCKPRKCAECGASDSFKKEEEKK